MLREYLDMEEVPNEVDIIIVGGLIVLTLKLM
jgi:hypothetical protein